MRDLYLALKIGRIPGGFIAAGICQNAVNEAVRASRGYEAMGSEIFVFPVVLVLTALALDFAANALGKYIRWAEKKRCGRKRMAGSSVTRMDIARSNRARKSA